MSEEIRILNLFFIQISKITTFCILIPIIVSIFQRKCLNKPLKVFFLYCCFSLSIALIVQFIIWGVTKYQLFWLPYLNKWNIHDTNFVAILGRANDIILLGWYFSIAIPIRTIGRIIQWVSLGLLISVIVNYFF